MSNFGYLNLGFGSNASGVSVPDWTGYDTNYFKWNNNVFPSNRQSVGLLKVQTTHPYNDNLQDFKTSGSGSDFSNAIYINAAGTLFYACKTGTDVIRQFELTSAYDFSTMIPYAPNNNNFKSLAITEPDIRGVYFSTDGSKFFIHGGSSAKIYRYDMSTNFDVASATQNTDTYSYSLSNPWGLWFESAGNKFFVAIYGTGIRRFDMSTAFDLSTVSTSTGTGWEYDDGQNSQYLGVSFSADGTKLYRNGNNGTKIYQSTLGVGWTISSASYTSSFTNSELLNTPGSNSRGPSNQYNGSPIIDQNNGTRLIYGTKSPSLNYGFVVDMSILSTPYLASSASYTTASSVAASSAWIDTSTNVSAGKRFIYFVNDGSAFFAVNPENQYIEKYSMSTPYDLSSAPAGGSPTQTLNPTAYENDIQGFYFKPDGKSLITIGGQGNGIDQWNMTTAWDLSTASHVGFQFVDTDNFTFFTVRPDGTEFFYNQGNNGTQPRQLQRRAINSAWNISAGIGSQQNTLLTDSANQNWNFNGGKFSADGKQFLCSSQYSVSSCRYSSVDYDYWLGLYYF